MSSQDTLGINLTLASWLLYFIASGLSFFVGIGGLLVAVALRSRETGKRARWLHLLVIASVIAIALSSTPLPLFAYGFLTAVLITWWLPIWRLHVRQRLGAALAGICFAIAVLEARYHLEPSIEISEATSFAILGDSLTAGIGDSDPTTNWATLVAREFAIELSDYSRMGATVGSTLERVDVDAIDASLVLVELGGNDILGSTTPSEFE